MPLLNSMVAGFVCFETELGFTFGTLTTHAIWKGVCARESTQRRDRGACFEPSVNLRGCNACLRGALSAGASHAAAAVILCEAAG